MNTLTNVLYQGKLVICLLKNSPQVNKGSSKLAPAERVWRNISSDKNYHVSNDI